MDRFGRRLYPNFVDYQYRPLELDQISLYNFVRHFEKCPLKTSMYSFVTEHPNSGTHGIRLRSLPILPSIAITVPSASSDDAVKSRRFKIIVFILFCPWRDLVHEFSVSRYEHVLNELCSPTDRIRIKHLHLLSVSKSEALLAQQDAEISNTIPHVTPPVELCPTLDTADTEQFDDAMLIDVTNIDNTSSDSWLSRFSMEDLRGLPPAISAKGSERTYIEGAIDVFNSIYGSDASNDVADMQTGEETNWKLSQSYIRSITVSSTVVNAKSLNWAAQLKAFEEKEESQLNAIVAPAFTALTKQRSLFAFNDVVSHLAILNTHFDSSAPINFQQAMLQIANRVQCNQFKCPVESIVESFSLNTEQLYAYRFIAYKLLFELGNLDDYKTSVSHLPGMSFLL